MMSDLRDNFSAVTERINNILVAHSEFKIAGCFFLHHHLLSQQTHFFSWGTSRRHPPLSQTQLKRGEDSEQVADKDMRSWREDMGVEV